MATSADLPPPRQPPPSSDTGRLASILKKFLGRSNRDKMLSSPTIHPQEPRSSLDSIPGSALMRRVGRKVVPNLPRAKTFKRQQSEVREKLEAIQPTPAERRAVSVDRRLRSQASTSRVNQQNPRASAPDFLDDNRASLSPSAAISQRVVSAPESPIDEKHYLSLEDIDNTNLDREHHDQLEPAPSYAEALSVVDVQSTTESQYDAMINEELERKWILNLSMHFRDKSRREKFFVTYREDEFLWRRVTISLDYRNAPDDSLEKDLLHIRFQREKSAKIYEAIRESLQDIQFYQTVTNLKLQTTDGRLHVHVVEDVSEIINYPTVRMIEHLKCSRIRERDLIFDSHMSGFVYKVRVAGRTLIKKEIPGPDTVDEFLYEVNALNSLKFSQNVIEFFGVVVDDKDEVVKGLLINYAEKGALIDVIYDSQEEGNFLPWPLREKWARQIVQGVSDVHEAGFVQGDLTLSNIVIDREDNAKIIDINRRGCPVGWEPPEATPLIDSNQRISMYIGVKSDLYQLGMVLWALATLEDEPEAHRRPLHLDPEIEVPDWYRTMVEHCLHEDPRVRLQATKLLELFPQPAYDDDFDTHGVPSISVDDGFSLREYIVDELQRNGHHTHIRPAQPGNAWVRSPFDNAHPTFSDDQYYSPSRGRSRARSMTSGIYSPPYDVWPNPIPDQPVGGMDLGEEERADTPREGKTPSEIVAKFQQDLNQLEAEEAQSPDGENQTVDATLATDANNAPDIANDDVEVALPPTVDENLHAIAATGGTAAAAVLKGEQAPGSLQSEIRDKVSNQTEEMTEIDETRGVGTTAAGTVASAEGAVQPPRDRGTESHDNQTHDRREETPTRLTGAYPSRAAGSPPGDAVLTGVGSGHLQPEETEQLPTSFSDEDLGIPTTASPNVTFQA